MSRGDIIGGAAVPLTDALPWEVPAQHRTLLVNDSIGTDGRFLLYTLASQITTTTTSSSSASSLPHCNKGRCLWLACGPVTEPQVLQGLKKIGCDKSVISQARLWGSKNQGNEGTATGVQEGDLSSSSLMTIRSVACEIATQLQKPDSEFEEQAFLKEIYQSIQTWLKEGEENSPSWIILDDVSALANLLGERIVYSFLLALNSRNGDKYGLMIRCSNDSEEESLPTLAGSSLASGPDWFGAGGLGLKDNAQYNPQAATCSDIPWERSLVDFADGIMDVMPLTSGYTRELHGRIVFTQVPQGLGWGCRDKKSRSKMTSPMQIINYCIAESKIVAYVL